MSLLRTLSVLHPATSRAPSGRLLGFGAVLPATTISGAELAAPFGRSADWIQARTGIRTLRRLGEDEDLLELATASASSALTRAGLDADHLDLVIATSCSTLAGASAIGG